MKKSSARFLFYEEYYKQVIDAVKVFRPGPLAAIQVNTISTKKTGGQQ